MVMLSRTPISELSGRAFGRIAVPDGRDKNFSVGRLMSMAPRQYHALPKEKLYPQDAIWLDQGQTSECTSYGWHHRLIDSDAINVVDMQKWGSGNTATEMHGFYCEEQTKDPWPGDCNNPPFYDGTSVRAGAQVARDRAWIKAYLWCFDIMSVEYSLIDLGPIVLGIDWYAGMSDVDGKGVMKVRGQLEGGHCVVLNGFVKHRLGDHWFRIKNSWGRSWGDNGNGWIQKSELKKLITADSEFCVPLAHDSAVDVTF